MFTRIKQTYKMITGKTGYPKKGEPPLEIPQPLKSEVYLKEYNSFPANDVIEEECGYCGGQGTIKSKEVYTGEEVEVECPACGGYGKRRYKLVPYM